MKPVLDESQPIFLQIAWAIQDEIVDGHLKEGEPIPSTTELSRFYNINRATAQKGIQMLVEEDIIFKKRGVGMFVADGAKEKLLKERQHVFFRDFVKPLLEEAKRIHIDKEKLIELIHSGDDEHANH